MAIDVDHAGSSPGSIQRQLQEVLGCHQVPVGRQHKIDRVPDRIDGAIQVHPVSRYANIGLVDSPGSIRMTPLPPRPLVQDRRITLYPTPNRDVINRKTALHHHFFQVAIAQRVAQIPADAQNDDHVLEVPPSEQRRSLLPHGITVPKPSAAVATDPVDRTLSLQRARRDPPGTALRLLRRRSVWLRLGASVDPFRPAS